MTVSGSRAPNRYCVKGSNSQPRSFTPLRFVQHDKPTIAKDTLLPHLPMTSADGGKVIWIVNHYAGSRVHGMEYRHYYLAQQFLRLGLQPVIISASFHHLLTKVPQEKNAEVDGVPYAWIQTCRYEKNDARRVLNMVEFSARLAWRNLSELPRPQVVIASSPHPFAAFNGHRLAKQ